MYHHTEVDFNIKSSAHLSMATNEQAVAQAELSAYIEAQAQAIAPELEVQFIDLDNFYNYKALANGETIAIITHDCVDFVTQPWVVMVGEVEVHRANTWAK
ncbi:MAG: hypothetical protein PUP91_37805 [Rhizonema sp. PD37]|nr:hypothetical protein [Rhizonema sp. PD37]